MIAATNPCPCGYYGSHERYCTCSPKQISHYQLKVSGPILDRMDFVLSLKSSGLQERVSAESSLTIRKRVKQARKLQKKRYGKNFLNGTVPFWLLDETSGLSSEQQHHINKVCFVEKWSNRAQVKLIRIARTIADLQGSLDITDSAITEAVEWKMLPTGLQVPTILGGE